MVCLHCGWPKTGTSSLQATLAKHGERLKVLGVDYPAEWRDTDGSHNGLVDVLRAYRRHGDAAFDGVKGYLASNEDRAQVTLFSSEALTAYLVEEESLDSLLALLGSMREVAPVKCVWILRRFDELVHAYHLQPLDHQPNRFGAGGDVAKIMEGLELGGIFVAMRAIERRLDGDVAYVKYDSGGSHQEELLRVCHLPPAATKLILPELSGAVRVNTAMSHKQAAAVAQAGELSRSLGFPVDRPTLTAAFRAGLRFEDDGPCELAGRAPRRKLHERMLRAASAADFPAYGRFFGDQRLEAVPPPSSLSYGVLSQADLDRLALRLGGAEKA